MDRTRAITSLDIRELDARRKELPLGRMGGYRIDEVDAFLEKAVGELRDLLDENEALRAGVSPEHLWGNGIRATPTITPSDVQAEEFQMARFGRAYRMREVDEYLDDLTDMLSRLEAENEALRARSPSE